MENSLSASSADADNNFSQKSIIATPYIVIRQLSTSRTLVDNSCDTDGAKISALYQIMSEHILSTSSTKNFQKHYSNACKKFLFNAESEVSNT